MWYTNTYRRYLCDMHIDDWDKSFMSEFEPESFIENLKKAGIQNAMLYAQSHVGLCFYPTKIGEMHRAFIGKEDMMKRTADLCHKNGISVTIYYSLNFNNVEHDKHKEWRMVTESGVSRREGGTSQGQALDFASLRFGRYGICCPNKPEYREFVYSQIDEIMDYFDDCEGLFFDMPFWYYTCYCDKCSERWKKEMGGKIPVDPKQGSAEHINLMDRKHAWMGEWIQSVTDYVKKKNDKISVSYNFASAVGGNSDSGTSEGVNNASDYVGGDLYGGNINHSFASKFYKNITHNMPFEYMFSRCKPALRTHTLTKSFDEMKTEVMITAAHQGATLVIDAIDPIGTVDSRVYERVGKVFDFEKQYEKYFGGEMKEDIGLYYSIRSRFNSQGEIYDSLNSCKCITETFIERHIPFGVTGSSCDINKHRILIIPNLASVEDNDVERIKSYVEKGGNIYISGTSSPLLMKDLIGGTVNGRTEEEDVYIAPIKEYEHLFNGFNSKYPLPFEGTAPMVEVDGECEVLATVALPYTKPSEVRFASIHSDPPGKVTAYPAVIKKKIGKGTVIWSAMNIEAITVSDYRDIFMNIVELLADGTDFSFTSDAPDDVEITVFEKEKEYVVNLVSISEKSKVKTNLPFSVSVRTDCVPLSVNLMPNGENVDFVCKDGYVTFKTREHNIYDMYIISK